MTFYLNLNNKVKIINIKHFKLREKIKIHFLKKKIQGFPGGAGVENLPANAGDTGSSPGLGRSHMPRSNWAREPQIGRASCRERV